MLLQNGYRDAFTSLRYFGAGTTNGAYPNIANSNWQLTGARRNIFMGEAVIDSKASIPDGTRHPVAWQMPQKAGGLSCRNNVYGAGSIAADILAVKLATVDLTGSGDITQAVGGLVVQLLADLLGDGEVSSGDLKAFLQAVAALSGSGGATGAALTGLGALILSMSGSGTAGASVLTATGELDADLTVTGTGLSTSNVGQAVWASLASANNTAGTMGEKLNDAGSASNPWTEVIESGLTAAEVLRIILAVQAGKTTIAGSDVSFRDVDDTKDRVLAEMTGSERTTVTLDGS